MVCTTWRTRAVSPEQAGRMMNTWGKLEAKMAEDSSIERLCWYINADDSGGFTVVKAVDVEAATAFQLETSVALGEFLEFDSRIVLDMDTAMPAILAGMEHVNS